MSNCTKMSSTLIYLARHGETTGNMEKIIKDPFKNLLTKRGQSQAALLGESLSKVPFTRVYSSNFPRAEETASIAKDKLQSTSIPFIQDSRIRELEDDKYIGQSYSVFHSICRKVKDSAFPDYADFDFEGCEPVGEAIERQESFFEELFANLDQSKTPETVLIVSHGCLIRLIMQHFNVSKKYDAKSWKRELSSQLLENCAYHSFEVSKCDVDSKTKDEVSPRAVKFLQVHQAKHLH